MIRSWHILAVLLFTPSVAPADVVVAARTIRLTDVGPPAIIDRNQIVPLIFERAGLRINSEGRSLMRAGPGDIIRVMNLSSRLTVTGKVQPDGRVTVSH